MQNPLKESKKVKDLKKTTIATINVIKNLIMILGDIMMMMDSILVILIGRDTFLTISFLSMIHAIPIVIDATIEDLLDPLIVTIDTTDTIVIIVGINGTLIENPM